MKKLETGKALIKERERLVKKRPGLRDSYAQFLESFKQYTESVEKPPANQRSTPPGTKFLK